MLHQLDKEPGELRTAPTDQVGGAHVDIDMDTKSLLPKILLVEDNEMSRDMLARRLQRRGYNVVTAADGAEGVRMAHAERPNLILMDLSLPVLDGWGASQRLKSDAGTKNIPVIALTAHAMAGDEIRARAVGCDDFDTKPVDFTRLLSKISNLLAISSNTAAQQVYEGK